MTLWAQMGGDEREGLVARLVGGFDRSGVPEHLRAGLLRYFSDGILPGGFLQAVLGNDLRDAVTRADPQAFYAIGPIVEFLCEHAPDHSWGSRAAVLAWTTTPDRLEL